MKKNKKIKNSPPVLHLPQAQQAPALLYAKAVGRPGTGSYPAPSPDPTTHGREYVILSEMQDDTLFIQQIKEYWWHYWPVVFTPFANTVNFDLIWSFFHTFLMACNKVFYNTKRVLGLSLSITSSSSNLLAKSAKCLWPYTNTQLWLCKYNYIQHIYNYTTYSYWWICWTCQLVIRSERYHQEPLICDGLQSRHI